jgi:hypothetical protein
VLSRYVAGATIGGSLLGAILASLSGLARLIFGRTFTTVGALTLATVLLALVVSFGQARVIARLPHRNAGLPADWPLTLGPERTAFGWGLLLGTGFSTYLVTPLLYVAFLLIFATQDVPLQFAFAIGYGLVRGGALAISLMASVRVGWDLTARHYIVPVGQRIRPLLYVAAASAITATWISTTF